MANISGFTRQIIDWQCAVREKPFTRIATLAFSCFLHAEAMFGGLCIIVGKCFQVDSNELKKEQERCTSAYVASMTFLAAAVIKPSLAERVTPSESPSSPLCTPRTIPDNRSVSGQSSPRAVDLKVRIATPVAPPAQPPPPRVPMRREHVVDGGQIVISSDDEHDEERVHFTRVPPLPLSTQWPDPGNTSSFDEINAPSNTPDSSGPAPQSSRSGE